MVWKGGCVGERLGELRRYGVVLRIEEVEWLLSDIRK
jgi:hypothetical protein